MLLRSANNIDDVALKVSPSGETSIAFRRSNHSWHGHLPSDGERRVIQFK